MTTGLPRLSFHARHVYSCPTSVILTLDLCKEMAINLATLRPAAPYLGRSRLPFSSLNSTRWP